MWRIIDRARIVQDDCDANRIGILIDGKVYPVGAEAPYSESAANLIGAVRQALYVEGGALKAVSENQRIILGCATDNGHGWSDRHGNTVYLIPVPERASKVTVACTDTGLTQMQVNLVSVVDGTYVGTNTGWVDFGECDLGDAQYIAVNLKASADVAWDYDATANVSVTFT